MKHLVKVLALGGALLVLASAAVVSSELQVHCDQAKCTPKVTLEGGSAQTYKADCDQQGYSVSDFVCYAAPPNITCETATSPHWKCLCDNWSLNTESTTLSIQCVPHN